MSLYATPWPPLHVYALAHRCPTCKAEPGVYCDAPRKNGRLARRDQLMAQVGLPPAAHRPIERLHAARQHLGAAHHQRDIGNAPWADEREPGRRYDSLGDLWAPKTTTDGDDQ